MSETWTVVPGYRSAEYTDPMIFKFDLETKKIEKITKQVIVSGEKNSQYICFVTDRYFDGIDLVGKRIQIVYLGYTGRSDINEVVNVECTDENIRFGWVVPGNACYDPGTMCFSLEFVGEDYVLKSRKYDLEVTEGLNGGSVIPEPEEKVWYIELQERCDEILTKAESASTSALNVMSAIGSPTVAATAAAMSDTTKVYVYTGSETGYTYGDWYYYDGEDWVSGGEYASTALTVDATLSKSGQAADAKAVGDAIERVVGDVADDIAGLKQEIIDGRVIKSYGGEQQFTSDDFVKGIINTSTGSVNGNSTIRVNVDGTNKLLYGMVFAVNGSGEILPTTITSVSSNDTAYIFVVAYDKDDTTNTGYIGYYDGSEFTKPLGVVADTQYIDLAALSAEYPDYRFKLVVVDTSTTDPLNIPTVAAKASYTEPTSQDYRQLVKTVNDVAPDASGNIELNFLDSVDAVPTAGSENPVASGGVKTAIDAVAAEIPDIDDTLAQTGQAADAKAVGDEISALKQDIIDGKVAVGEGTADILPSASDFQNAKITPKNGNIVANGNVYMNVGGVGNTYYPLLSTDFLPDDIKAIQGSYSDVKFVLFVYDKTSSEYLGAIFDGYVYKSISDLTASNTLYPYSEVNMDTLKTTYPDYKYKLEITDIAVNHDTLPVVSDVLQWCTYTVPRATSERQLVKTVNNTVPDNSGNISLSIPGAEEIEGYIVETYVHVPLDSSVLANGFYRYDTGISNANYQASIIPKGDQYRHSYYGIIFKNILAENIFKITTSGTIYALIAGFSKADGSFVGYYTGAGFEIPERSIDANNVDTQNINLKALREQYPNYFFKVSFADVSTYDRPDIDDVLDSVVFVYENASKHELEKVSDTNIPELPAYWADYLDGRIEDIRENMMDAGRNGETFVFITDLHWPSNVKNSPRVMFEILRRLNIHHCICGGDVINEGTREESVGVMADVVNAFKHYDIDFLTAVGNHDRNWNIYNNQRDYPERRFSEADVFSLLERMSKQVYQNFADDKFDNGIGFNMYYDDPITNTRFIIIDINDGILDENQVQYYEFTNYNELAQVLHDSDGKNIVIVSHILGDLWDNTGIGRKLGAISDALNARTTISTDYCTADFTGCTGKVYLIVGGHAHNDSARRSSGGIPTVICDTDSSASHNTDAHIAGTTKEQAFDVITVNYADNSVKFVRIGRGSDRTFTAGS